MFKRNLKKRKNRLKRLNSLRSLVSRKRCNTEKVEKHQREIQLLVSSIK